MTEIRTQPGGAKSAPSSIAPRNTAGTGPKSEGPPGDATKAKTPSPAILVRDELTSAPTAHAKALGQTEPATTRGTAMTPVELMRRAQADGVHGYNINQRIITPGYIALSKKFQAIIEPSTYDPTRPGSSGVIGSWFAAGAHPSHAAGTAMSAAREVRAQIKAGTLGLFNPGALLTAFFKGMKYIDLDEFARPTIFAAALMRFGALVASAPGNSLAEKADAVFSTMENLFAEGNQGIFGDIGEAGIQYLAYREANPDPSPDTVLENFRFLDSTKEGAQELFDSGLRYAANPRFTPPNAFNEMVPVGRGPDSLVAAMALYEQARLTDKLPLKNRLIDVANSYLVIREQRDLIDPVMNGAVRKGEVSRSAWMEVLTPTLQVPAGGMPVWEFSKYSTQLPSKTSNPFKPVSTQYNWADANVRIPAIWHFFRRLQQSDNVPEVWKFPNVDSSLPL